MEPLIGAVGVLAVLMVAFSLLDFAAVRFGINERPAEPAREWWERGW